MLKDPTDVIRIVQAISQGKPFVALGSLLTSMTIKTRPNLGNCLSMNISKMNGISTLDSILFLFKKNLEGNVQIQLEDSKLFADRKLSVQSIFTTGDGINKQMKEDDIVGFGSQVYDVMLSENVFVENDKSKGCKNYPNEQFVSYNECDKHFVEEEIERELGPEYLPFWATDSLDDVSEGNMTEYSGESDTLITSLLDGSKTAPCPLPCRTTSIRTKFVGESYAESASIKINFANTVPVTKTDFVQPNLEVVLSGVGGSLGLWLGLGVLQLLEVFVMMGERLLAKYRGNKIPT